jgi:hypothetical protein
MILTINDFSYRRNSANIASYAEQDGPLTAEVYEGGFYRDGAGAIRTPDVSTYTITVYNGREVVKEFSYTPRVRHIGGVQVGGCGNLDSIVVTNLIRRELA